MPMRLAGGGVVTPGGVLQADVVVEDGRIVALEAPASRGDIDARGWVVLTDGVDPHAHPLADIARPRSLRAASPPCSAFTAPRPAESPAESTCAFRSCSARSHVAASRRAAGRPAGGTARAFGLALRKGALVPGADADLVVWDPERTWTIGAESPFAGLEVTGDACLILLHGHAVG
jgi:dihydroorotase-like cyclic amidohydrolase